MKHITTIMIYTVRNKLNPFDFYCRKLGGEIGKPTGNGWHRLNALCPFHDDKHSGSFHIHKDGAYMCHACGEKGHDIIDYIMKLERVGFPEAISILWGYKQCAK